MIHLTKLGISYKNFLFSSNIPMELIDSESESQTHSIILPLDGGKEWVTSELT